MKRFNIFFLVFVGGLTSANTPERKTAWGYFVSHGERTFFTQILNSTAPLHRVEWMDRPHVICPSNKFPACRPVELSFVEHVDTNPKGKEIIYKDAILANKLRALQARPKSSR